MRHNLFGGEISQHRLSAAHRIGKGTFQFDFMPFGLQLGPDGLRDSGFQFNIAAFESLFGEPRRFEAAWMFIR